MVEVRRYGTTERLLELRAFPPFEALPRRAVVAVSRSLEELSFVPGEELLSADAEASALVFLMKGAVETWHDGVSLGISRAPGRAALVSLLAGAILGVRDGTGSVGTRIVALEPTDALYLHHDSLVELMAEHFEVFCSILRHLASALLREQRALGLEATDELFHHVLARVPRPTTSPTVVVRETPLTKTDRLFALRALPHFRRMNVNAIAAWASRLEERRYPPGATLWKPGELATDFAILVQGTAVERGPGGEVHTQPPLLVGGPEAILGENRESECVALTELVTLHASMDVVLDICEEHLEVGLGLASLLASLLTRMQVARARRGDPPEDDGEIGFERLSIG